MKYSPKNAITVSINFLKLNGLDTDVPRAGCPPSVRPTEEYAGPGAPASLTADSIAVVRPRTSAPRMVLITEPALKIMNVGILCCICQRLLVTPPGWETYALTPYCCDIACWLSTLIFVKVTRSGLECFVASDSYVGATALHGPHQSA